MNLQTIGKQAKEASKITKTLSASDKNRILKLCADALEHNTSSILSENEIDIYNAEQAGIKGSFIDRLKLNEKQIAQIAKGLRDIAELDDPIGEILGMKTLPNGLKVGQKRVAMGVIGIIYESRPNVTADAFGLCIKSGNTVILKGGKDAIRSNTAIVDIIRETLTNNGFNENFIQLIKDTSRETTKELMKLNKFIDVLIPRGGSGLIKSVVENSTIPVIETGTGNCHIFVDESADLDTAVKIVINAKTSRPGVCNATEKLLVHKNIAERFLPLVCNKLSDLGVEIRGDKFVKEIIPNVILASDDDWYTEYLDLVICIGVVESVQTAIDHISTYSSGHSECIITDSYENSQKFLDDVDSAAVYVNASTRFTDGGQFGLGAEIGISTQKLHARGPMGIKELTTTKYIVYGNGHIRY